MTSGRAGMLAADADPAVPAQPLAVAAAGVTRHRLVAAPASSLPIAAHGSPADESDENTTE